MIVLAVVKRGDACNSPTILLGYEISEDPTYADEIIYVGIQSDDGDDTIFACESDPMNIWRDIEARWGDWLTYNAVYPEMTDEEYWNSQT